MNHLIFDTTREWYLIQMCYDLPTVPRAPPVGPFGYGDGDRLPGHPG